MVAVEVLHLVLFLMSTHLFGQSMTSRSPILLDTPTQTDELDNRTCTTFQFRGSNNEIVYFEMRNSRRSNKEIV